VIGALLADTEKMSKAIVNLIYHGIASHMIFLDTTGSDDPIDKLDPPQPRQRGIPFVRGSIKLLYFLPGITVFLCVIFDGLTIFYLEAPFRFPHKPLSAIVNPDNIGWILAIEIMAIILGTLNFVMSARIVAFQNATEKLLRQYHQYL
jgi:hypothetical protein